MPNVSDPFFVQHPEAPTRSLIGASLMRVDLNVCHVLIDAEGLTLSEDDEIRVYFTDDRGFVEQSACVVSISERPVGRALGLKLLGCATLAESRSDERSKAANAGVRVDLAGTRCTVLDASASGFSVVCGSAFLPGSVVPVSLDHSGDFYSGEAQIRSARREADGHVRYGLFVDAASDQCGDLADGLRAVVRDLALNREKPA
jgi:hypothetical protein